MALDLKNDALLTFAQASRYLPQRRLGKPTHPATLWRWSRKGVLVNGRRVFLEVTRTPSGGATSIAALERFLTAITGGDTAVTREADSVSNVSNAVKELDRDGV